MKNFLLICFSLVFVKVLNAQAPQGLNYQAVARDAITQKPLISLTVSVKFSILNGSASGVVIYVENQTTQTNPYGLFNFTIGQGNITAFSAIDWSNGPKFLKVEINNTLLGTTQLLSVPYALYAKKVETESQTLSITGNTLSISGGNSITLPNSNTPSGITTLPQTIETYASNHIPIAVSTATASNNGSVLYIGTYADANNPVSSAMLFRFERDANGYYHKTHQLSGVHVTDRKSVV